MIGQFLALVVVPVATTGRDEDDSDKIIAWRTDTRPSGRQLFLFLSFFFSIVQQSLDYTMLSTLLAKNSKSKDLALTLSSYCLI